METRLITTKLSKMPYRKLFDLQPEEYRREILPVDIHARLAVEAGSPQGWEKYTGYSGAVIGFDHFGVSAPGKVLMEQFGFTVENVVKRATGMVRKA